MNPLPQKIKKRDGTLVDFDSSKIERAVYKAALEVEKKEESAQEIAQKIVDKAKDKASSLYKDKIPCVENIQDIVEEALMESGYSSIAKRYILYRQQHHTLRQTKVVYGVRDDMKLPLNTILVLKKRYLLKNQEKKVIETPQEMFQRVAKTMSQAESNYKSSHSSEEAEEKFLRMMTNLEFIPNSPTLMNAGTPLGQLSACFVLPVDDSMEAIFDSLKGMAKIHQSGGGTGFDFSRLRPRGDLVSTTKGEASGPVSFMKIFDQATGVIVQGGRRRGANIGILRCDHPDIFDFVEAKLRKEDIFSNFNLSVGITDKFMEAVREDKNFDLINPRTKTKVRSVKARGLFDVMVYSAWQCGDPGLVFLDEINRRNPVPDAGRIEATNPCGEVPLLPYESCNLASINLSRFVEDQNINWMKLKETVWGGVRFLDDVIEMNNYPLPQIKEMTCANRKIGLGVMGFADMLIKMKIPYTSEKALVLASKIMRFIHQNSLKASQALAEERGTFPNYEKSVYAQQKTKIRNSTVNTIAPTGTISIIAGCSSGIEPLFALSYVRRVLSGTKMFETHPLFEKELRERGLYSKQLMAEIGKWGSIQNIPQIPDELKRVFITSFDVSPEIHLRIQAAFQKYTDNSVSKTINLPQDATVDEVKNIFFQAYELKCKGITIYRYGTKENQVLSFESPGGEKEDEETKFVTAAPEYSGGCQWGACTF